MGVLMGVGVCRWVNVCMDGCMGVCVNWCGCVGEWIGVGVWMGACGWAF